MINKRIKTIQIAILLTIMFIVLACNPIFMDQVKEYPNDLSDFIDRGDYEINPKTILADLDQGKSNVFSPVIETSIENSTAFPLGTFPWHQSDYLKIADALQQFVWKESLKDWSLYSMLFFRGCQNDPVGFDSVGITYYKADKSEKSYTAREFDIYPVGKGVSWGGGTSFPRPLFGWKSIDLGRLKITADNALQMAEDYGGKLFRLKTNNSCKIDVMLKPNGDHDDWIVTYYPNGSSNIFKIYIDPYNGWISVP